MKKKVLGLLLIVVVLMSACSNKNQSKTSVSDDKLAKNEEVFTWWEDRSKPFGNFDYPAISEEEAVKLMTSKFNLKIPDFFYEAKKISEKNLVIEGAKLETAVYNVFATGDEVLFSGVTRVKDSNDNYLSYAKAELKYQYIEIQNKVKLQSQSLSFYNLSEDTIFNEKSLPDVLADFSGLLQLQDQEKLLIRFNENTKDNADLAGKEVSIYRTLDDAYKKNKFGKNLVVTYNDDGKVKIIDGVISDYRL